MTAVEQASNPARRGDLVLVVREQRDSYIGRPSETRTVADFAVVTSVTRAGLVKAVRDAWGEVGPARRYGDETVYVLEAARVDVEAVMRMAAGHAFPSGAPRPFGSLDEAREALRPHLRTAESSAAAAADHLDPPPGGKPMANAMTTTADSAGITAPPGEGIVAAMVGRATGEHH